MWQHWMGLYRADVPQHILVSWPSCQGAMVGHAHSWSLGMAAGGDLCLTIA